MRLNEEASTARSRTSPASRRVSSRPLAIASAACDTSRSGRSARPEAHRPSSAPAMVVTAPAVSRATRMIWRVRAVGARENTSKYAAFAAGIGTPTA